MVIYVVSGEWYIDTSGYYDEYFLGGCMEDGGCCCQKQMIETNCHKWNFTRFQSTSPFKCISKMYGSTYK